MSWQMNQIVLYFPENGVSSPDQLERGRIPPPSQQKELTLSTELFSYRSFFQPSEPFRSIETYQMKKKIPQFKSENTERKFWGKTDSTNFVDWEASHRVVLPNLKPSQKTISLRLPAMMLAELKRLANKRGVSYQSLLKVFLAERLDEELRPSKTKRSVI